MITECSPELGVLFSNCITCTFRTREWKNMGTPSKDRSMYGQKCHANMMAILWMVWEKRQLCRRITIRKEIPRIHKKRSYDNVRRFFSPANTSVLKAHLPEKYWEFFPPLNSFLPISHLHHCLYRSLNSLFTWGKICTTWHWNLSKALNHIEQVTDRLLCKDVTLYRKGKSLKYKNKVWIPLLLWMF